MDKFSYISNLSNADVAYVDELYLAYKNEPTSVDETWQQFFAGFDFSIAYADSSETDGNGHTATETPTADVYALAQKELWVRNLIQAYRSRGHLKSKTNPVRPRRDRKAMLDLADFKLSDADLNQEFVAGKALGLGKTTLKNIVAALEKIYLGSIGFEFSYIRNPEIYDWLKDKIEKQYLTFSPKLDQKKRILKKLNEAVVFENFLQTKFLGQKRFSLEGGESTIPALDAIINKAAELGAAELIIGMAHRGRLNVLTNIIGKTYEEVFSEFEGKNAEYAVGEGDVKYHMGYTNTYATTVGKVVDVHLLPNPSHLEAVNPVILGATRAQIDKYYEGDNTKMVPILIHGDAAVAGQGIVYEVVQMSELKGYNVGGTIHFVINNQVGFTTDFEDARSSNYCTDVATMLDSPVLHVNGDDPEAVIFAVELATEFRQKFQKDIFIDMVCYRRHGHNETDEPRFTQPLLYNIIAKHPNPRDLYNKRLLERADVDANLADEMDKEFKQLLQDRLNLVKQQSIPHIDKRFDEEWAKLSTSKPGDFEKSPATAVALSTLEKVMKALVSLPNGFKPIKQIEKLMKDRQKSFFEDKEVNWASGELLAYGTLLTEGKMVRLTGQDVERGTFSHRHAVVKDAETNEDYCQLNHIEEGQEKYWIYNSLLSEYGVLGFEYGYSFSNPNALVLWEAQFGDFANGAQIMIDQFIAAGETKWNKMNGLVMLLPHGYEGQGPEHSSARPERFLQLCAEYNMIVANITTPANYFHLLRRQLAWTFRKPCVVMSPKSLLRHPKCVSPIEDFTKGGFQEIIADDYAKPANKVTKLIFCTGKIYYELLEKQQTDKRKDVAIVRLEQIHPFPFAQFDTEVAKYKKAKVYWVQEEPENMGYWAYLLRTVRHVPLELISRKVSASTATGFSKVHAVEQAAIINKVFE
ncbi:MAG: 2-oxoglutarate dehydrogenase E1 component [Cytophagales bacterium]|nr:MAG: 2-oxoglutarate dehydrogenase E1 component [Cytophagales bacterium]